jgi:uncharacterized protein (TIGR02444 family)
MAAGGRGHGEALWRFSLAFYARPGVATALVALQDRDGLDVNVILYALWLGLARGQAMTAADLAAAEAAAAPLRDAVVVELRGLRRRLRAHPDPDVQALRRRVQALEISAERAVQERLAGSVPAPHPGPLPVAARRGRDPRAAGEGEGPAPTEGIALTNLALCLGRATQSGEAETIRAALAEFSRCA